MSRGFDNLITNDYIVNMNRGELAAWLEHKYLEWMMKNGRENIDVFAAYLGISQPYLSLIMTGSRKTIGMKTAVKIAKKLNDYSILELLGYDHPQESVPFSSLPPDLIELLQNVDLEIAKTFRERAIDKYSPEAESVAREILEKYGLKSTLTKNSGNLSD